MKLTYQVLLIVHVLLVFAVAIWLMAQGREDVKRIPKGFISLTFATMALSLAMMQINLMQHNADSEIDLLNPFKYGVKTAVFALVIAIAIKNYKKPAISQKAWQAMIALMALDLIITGAWM